MSAPAPLRSLRPPAWAAAAVIFAVTLAVYWPALQGEILWDDPAHLTRPDLRSLDGLVRIWTELRATQQYYPVLHTAFWLEHRLWGDALLGYHLVNVVLHALSAVLLAAILRRLRRPDAAAPGGAGWEWCAALLFAVHPVAVESVAWISEQKNTLSLALYLGAGLLYLDYVDTRRARAYAGASALFVLALGTKSVTATLPAALLVALWWRDGPLRWRRAPAVAPLAPWFAVGLAAGLFTAWVERNLIGAEGAAYDLSLVERALLAGRVLWFYAGSVAWPFDLAFCYPRWDTATAAAWWPYLAGAAAVTAGLWLARGRARGLLAGWLLYGGTLFPALGFFNVFPFVFSFVADHFQYHALPAALATLAGLLGRAAARAPRWGRPAAAAIVLAAAAVLAVHTVRESALYRARIPLYQASVDRYPASWTARYFLGHELGKDPARRDEAIRHLREAVRLNPDSPDALCSLAILLARDPAAKPEAIAMFRRAIELRPNYAEAHNNLAIEIVNQPGRLDEAIEHYRAALREKPDLVEVRVNLANALARSPERLPEALEEYLRAERLRPPSPQLLNAIGIAYARQRRFGEARQYWERAAALDPNYAAPRQNLRQLQGVAAP